MSNRTLLLYEQLPERRGDLVFDHWGVSLFACLQNHSALSAVSTGYADMIFSKANKMLVFHPIVPRFQVMRIGFRLQKKRYKSDLRSANRKLEHAGR